MSPVYAVTHVPGLYRNLIAPVGCGTGEWVMENHGVEPDIEVDNLPNRVMAGYDDQLDKAIEVLREELVKNPPQRPERPEPPEER